jgi:hypothetical protein
MYRRASVVVVALTIATVLGGCSESKSDTNALCGSKDKFAASVQSLKDVDVVKEGTSALRAAVERVQADGRAFMNEAKSSYGNEVEHLRVSLSELGTALKQVRSDGIQPVASAATVVQTSAATLIDKVQAGGCHGSRSA